METPITQETQNRIQQLKKEAGADVEIILGTTVFTVQTSSKDALLRIANVYGEKTVFRIINATFIQDALEFGTDKGRIEEYDYRRVTDGAGYDVWGVEKKALEMGLGKSDVLCGTPHDFFIRDEDEYRSSGLGIPEDRSAILIYDAEKLREIEGTDGYVFTNPEDKKGALLGVVKFKESLTEFEKEFNSLETVDEKIELLEREVFQNLNRKEDLKKTPYMALHIVELLYKESLSNTNNPSAVSLERIAKLKVISDRLDYELRMINFADNMESQVRMTSEAFSKGDNRRMELMRTWPDFVIETTESFLQEEGKLDEKYRTKLQKIIEEAKRCKVDLCL